MKPTTVALLASLGMLLSSVSVYSLTPPGGARSGGPEAAIAGGPEAVLANQNAPDLSRFTAGNTLTVEGRVGHPKMVRSSSGETFVMLEVKGAEGVKSQRAAPVNLSLVIDRSGSMKGTRIRNALAAATTAVDKLNEGDVVNVVTFDTRVTTVVQPTTITAASRDQVNAAIRAITLGGDTCVSCGLEQGVTLLQQTAGRVNRMILLSDGDANHGLRDVPGFRALAQRAQSRGISVTTIGVDVDYNEKIMAAIAQDSNGRHYFVQNDEGLARVFEQEAQSLTSALASNTEVTIELAPGVELDRVFDRNFQRSGNRLVVPLGTFAKDEVKSVLLKVRVPSRNDGAVAIANVDLAYRDLVNDSDGRCSGKLGVTVVGSSAEASELDGVVAGRLQRSETANALKEANLLFEQGKVVEAQRRIDSQQQAVRAAAEVARRGPPSPKAEAASRDFENQISVLGGANTDFNAAPASTFATPPPNGAFPQATASPMAAPPQASRAGKSAVRQNQARAVPLGF